MTKHKTLERLAELAARRSALEAEIEGVVQLLRSPGIDGHCEATWQEVGDALGVSRQAAQQHYSYLSWAS